ncbi:MAG: cytochrome c3 family protein [Planctomycetota bacterium]
MLKYIILNPRTPLIVGIVLISIVVWMLFLSAPLPGGLADAHAQVHELNTVGGCNQCHTGSSLSDGCLSCHVEIAGQLADNQGYHAHLLAGKPTECVGCHAEHNGSAFPLVSKLSWPESEAERFSHPHVEFRLHGKHDTLDCTECHAGTQREPFALPDFPALQRDKTFLGLSQDCGECHDDPHAGGLIDDCGACHGQDAFHPTVAFDHGHLPLEGGHRNLSCDDCHRIPSPESTRRELPFPFHITHGKTCADCHESPHKIIDDACDQCHSGTDLSWGRALTSMTPERHAIVGFPLNKPHDNVECRQCHEPSLPFAERHLDPQLPGYDRQPDSCQGCHEDVHRGQFGSRRPNCIDCHEREHFTPTGFGIADHETVFPLTGAHKAVPCTDCHPINSISNIRMLVGIPENCASCHDDPHAGQFQEEIHSDGCESCHTETLDSFHLPHFAHSERTNFKLQGAHARAACDSCHIRALPPTRTGQLIARQYENTPTDCASCHRDVHRGQFAERESCDVCHTSAEEWSDITFDHDRDTSFPLEGNHSGVPCASCHQPVRLADGSSVVQYKPLGQECSDCHEIR